MLYYKDPFSALLGSPVYGTYHMVHKVPDPLTGLACIVGGIFQRGNYKHDGSQKYRNTRNKSRLQNDSPISQNQDRTRHDCYCAHSKMVRPKILHKI